MIQSAMMFALGAFASGLLWLAITVALVRRARRLTERRLLAAVSTRRAEFETERDELRARHAVQMHRLEREVSRVLDMATAYRLEADLKERDLVNSQAELAAREEEMAELQARLDAERETAQDLERRAAEAGSALRAVQHALSQEANRRVLAEEALEDAAALADRRRLEMSSLRAQNETMRALLGDRAALIDADYAPAPVAAPESAHASAAAPSEPATPLPADTSPDTAQPETSEAASTGASVVPLPTRNLRASGEAPEGGPPADIRLPQANMPEEVAVLADLDARRTAPAEDTASQAATRAELRVSEALAKIKALKRANSQAGE